MTELAPAKWPATERQRRFVKRVTHDFARRHLVAPGPEIPGEGSGFLLVAESTDPLVIWNLAAALECVPECRLAPGEQIVEVLDAIYSRSAGATSTASDEAMSVNSIQNALTDTADRDLLRSEGLAPVVQLLNAILLEALNRRASDVHLQSRDESIEIRYRIDGVLHGAHRLPRRLERSMLSRIKVLGEMDIAESRIPQDGRAMVTLGGRERRRVDLRISTIPTRLGERAVIRILECQSAASDLSHLGMPPDLADEYRQLAGSSSGMILLTGPTGSGKTTTLYATLHTVGRPDQNIMTIEDPIEYELGNETITVSQSQVNSAKGMTFAGGLRNILRQDPDIVMVGEIRDAETAAMAVQASLTGHLVFSTLHTNDAPSAVTRLENLGVDRYLICDSLLGVMAQRLVRRVHGDCGGSGCEECLGSGFLGRAGLYELLRVTPPVRAAISAGGDVATIKELAVREGMKTLRDRGDACVAAGVTSREEVLRQISGSGAL